MKNSNKILSHFWKFRLFESVRIFFINFPPFFKDNKKQILWGSCHVEQQYPLECKRLTVLGTKKSHKKLSYLKPGTEFSEFPSLVSQISIGNGFPWAVQATCTPVLLLKLTCDGGSCKNDGICTALWYEWSLIRIDAKHISEIKKKKFTWWAINCFNFILINNWEKF